MAVLGAGALGAAMAHRLGAQGNEVRIWNRHAERARQAADGAQHVTAVEQAADAVRDADAVLTVLPTGDVVAEVMGDLLDDVSGVWLQCSTVGPEQAGRLGDLAGQHDVAYLDAPVSGSTEPAEQGQLVWLVAGDADVVDRARPVLDALGKQVQHVGTNGTEGSAVKLAVNAWMTATTVVMGDVLKLCDGLGVGHDALREALGAGSLAMPYALQKSEHMDSGDVTPGFAVRLALKDLHLAADTVPPTDMLRDAADRLQRTVDDGHGDDDLAAVGRS